MYVTGYAKRSPIHASNFLNLARHMQVSMYIVELLFQILQNEFYIRQYCDRICNYVIALPYIKLYHFIKNYKIGCVYKTFCESSHMHIYLCHGSHALFIFLQSEDTFMVCTYCTVLQLTISYLRTCCLSNCKYCLSEDNSSIISQEILH